MDQQYSHRSNGNCQCQKCRTTGGMINNEDRSTGNMSKSEMMNEGVSHKEPFDRQEDDFIYPNW